MPKSSPLQLALSHLLILHKLPELLLLILFVASSTIPTARCWSPSLSSFHRHHHHYNPSSNRWMSFMTEPSRTIDITRPSSSLKADHSHHCRWKSQPLPMYKNSFFLSPKETMMELDNGDNNDDIHRTTTIDRRNWMIRSTTIATATILRVGSSNAQPTEALPMTTTIPTAHSTATATAKEEEDPLSAFGRSLSSMSVPSSTTSSSGSSGGGKTTTAVEFRLGVEGDGGTSSANSVGGTGSEAKSLEEAVRDAERRRRIDPRTHG